MPHVNGAAAPKPMCVLITHLREISINNTTYKWKIKTIALALLDGSAKMTAALPIPPKPKMSVAGTTVRFAIKIHLTLF